MLRPHYFCLMIVTGFIFISSIVTAQEFPIAAGSDTTSVGRAAFDGTNFLVPIAGDTFAINNLTAQLISSSGTLIGSRISVGKTGGGELIAFDGSNYLMVWSDPSNIVYGQFINTSGSLVRTPFVIADSATINNKGGCMAFGDTTYMVVWRRNDVHYGQRVSKSGNLIGTPTQISFTPARDNAICFDGTNYLVAWRSGGGSDTIYIHGQLISKSGVLVGSNFIIDGPYANDNPLSIAYDGSKYLVAYGDHTTMNGPLNIFARFVTTTGSVAPSRITISTKSPVVPSVIFDGTNYFITWSDNFYTANSVIMGSFIDTSGVPIDTAVTIFNSLGGKIAFYGMSTLGSNKILVVATRVDTPQFTNGDVYGKFIQSSTTGISENAANLTPKMFSLSQNYPDPFNPTTTISFSLPSQSFVSLKVYDIIGREVATIISGEMSAGTYSRQWNATKMSSGIYFYRLQSGSYTQTKKLVLLK